MIENAKMVWAKMKREIDIKDISDGKLYGLNDMVKADCHDCAGCSACCHGMGDSIVLDPMDLYGLIKGTGLGFSELLEQYLELGVVDGIILPHLAMKGEGEACRFLNSQGRCSIHGYRPGICRLFPLGRIYEDGGVKYFLQIHECARENRSKIKVKKWLDVPESKRYEQFILDWHYFLNDLEEQISVRTEEYHKNCNMLLLNTFFVTPYDVEADFYEQFYERFSRVRQELFDYCP